MPSILNLTRHMSLTLTLTKLRLRIRYLTLPLKGQVALGSAGHAGSVLSAVLQDARRTRFTVGQLDEIRRQESLTELNELCLFCSTMKAIDQVNKSPLISYCRFLAQKQLRI
eukprot:TRINITY_DN6441_c0_g1_i1.p1 TRINITY_DN6441_c0_g1~~TRINITY_DN6441_c0_g1_i1.p1  ORF type:complete len:112 (+),score=11.58 TRINITY_DN6441_c0_g1_i1:224-559(+)